MIDKKYLTREEYMNRVIQGYAFDGGFPVGPEISPEHVTHVSTEAKSLPYVKEFAEKMYPNALIHSYEAKRLLRYPLGYLQDLLSQKPIVIKRENLNMEYVTHQF